MRAFSLAIILLSAGLAEAQINRGAARGGGGRPGGGAAHAQRPSFSPPAVQRPQAPAARPNIGSSGMQRPNISQPNVSGFQRPNVNVPTAKPGLMPQTRPNLPTTGGVSGFTRPGTLPAKPNFDAIPRPGGSSGFTRPNPLPSNPGIGVLPNRPGAGGDGSGFTRPNPLPGDVTRPGAGGGGIQRPNPLPGDVTRPGAGGGGIQRPTPLPGDITRPGTGGGGTQWPNRPDIGVLPSRPPINDRFPNIDNRPDWVNRPNSGNIINNRPINNNVINSNNFNMIAPTIYNPNRPYGGYCRPYAGGVYRPYGWANYGNGYMWGNYYSARYYNHWHAGYWNCFHFPYGFVPRPVPLGWLLPATVNWNYYNPYWYNPPQVVQYVDYSQPIPVASETVTEAPTDTPMTVAPSAAPAAPAVPKVDESAAEAAAKIFEEARAQFLKSDYAAAEKTIDKALSKNPQDPTLHEFRALSLFAQGKFQESAAAIYAVLAAGPGWNADTLYAMYPDKLTFAKQLATLEQFAVANPKAGYAQFLLGYEYLTLGDNAKAVAAFKAAVAIEPKDELSAQLVKNLTAPPSKDPP